jgi:hypothetical protein
MTAFNAVHANIFGRRVFQGCFDNYELGCFLFSIFYGESDHGTIIFSMWARNLRGIRKDLFVQRPTLA